MIDDSEHVEQVFRIEDLKGEIEEATDGKCIFGEINGNMPPDIEEQFLEQVLAYERAEMVTHKELLARDGVALPAPDEMSDDELALKLIEIIHTLEEHRMYVYHTDHLSDRELYTTLCEDALNETGPILSPDLPMDYYLDLVGTGSDEDIDLCLKYYDDEEARARWAKQFPDMTIPPHEDPPYDRDRHLPKAPEPEPPHIDPEEEAAFWAECHGKLARKLETEGLRHGCIDSEPISYVFELACVWGIEHPDNPGTINWWAISGDLPTTWLPAEDIPDPRAFLRVISRHWHDAADAMEKGDPPPELTIGAPKDWPRLIPMLRFRADTLEHWANDDSAWEEELGL